MNKIDYLSLDGRSLYMLKLVHEHRSVTAAAKILGVTQSSVSHSLDRLRTLLGDPLFIKSGRAMVPTARLESMMRDIEEVLDGLQTLYHQGNFEPSTARERFSITANDFEHDLLVPAIFERLRDEAPHSSLRTYQHLIQGLKSLEKGETDMVLMPYPPNDAPDLVVTPLCTDRNVTYFDPARRSPPRNAEEFANGRHAILCLGRDERTPIDQVLAEMGLKRSVTFLGHSFSSIAMIVKGTDIMATAPSRMADSIFQDLSWVETPITLDPIDFYMVWHVRNRHSPRHKWFRELVKSVARNLPEINHATAEVRARRDLANDDGDFSNSEPSSLTK